MKYMTALHTLGDGYWSNAERAIGITRLEVPRVDKEDLYGELRVYFDPKFWNVNKLGLIYTDTLFLLELKEWLAEIGYNPADVSYSEQGMQGDDYVSLDAGPDFITSWIKQNEVEYV